jgi:hypothetical protein
VNKPAVIPTGGILPANIPPRLLQNQGQLGDANMEVPQTYSHLRPPRSLPQPPTNQHHCKSLAFVTFTLRST